MAITLVLLLLLVAELSLREYHRRTRNEALPAQLRRETRAVAWEDIERKYRIVCLGDSITHGNQLPYGQSYPAVLSDLLQRRYPDLDAYVINAGVCGHTSVQGLDRLERDVLWYRPHAVILSFGLNDGNLGHWPLDSTRERHMWGRLHLWERMDSAGRRSHLYLTIRGRARRVLRRLGWLDRPRPASTENLPQPRVTREGFALAQERLVGRIQESGCPTVFLATMTPVADVFHAELGRHLQQRQLQIYQDYNHIVRRIARRSGAHLLDLQALFAHRSLGESPRLRMDDGVHLTPAGQQLIALAVMQALENTGLPSSEPDRRR